MFRRLRRGSSALEFALMLGVTVPLMLGSAEFGWYLSQRIAVEHCTRDAARTAADVCNPANCNAMTGGECATCLNAVGVDPNAVAAAQFAQCWADTGYPGAAAATVTREGTAAAGNRRITVRGAVQYTPIAATTLLPNPIATALTMRFDDQSF